MLSLEEIASFGREKVFSTLGERYECGIFSRKLWSEMGEAGFLGMTVAEEYGGSGGDPLLLAAALREFARSGCDLGLTLCWITHLSICLKSIQSFGTEEQKRRYLPRLTSGEWVAAAAVSEPGTGAHPGGMKTTATPCAEGFILDGEKVFTTGGPVADLLMVLAVTGTDAQGLKEITAFLVETGDEGVDLRPMDLNFVKTAPHSETRFSGVKLAADSVLGSRGEGHSAESRGAFARERSSVLAAVSGLLAAAANEVADRYRQKNEGLHMNGVDAVSWIHHFAAIKVYGLVSDELVRASFEDLEDWRGSMDLLLYMGLSYVQWAMWIEDFIKRHGLESSFPMDVMLNDLKLVQVNEKLLMKEGRKRFLR